MRFKKLITALLVLLISFLLVINCFAESVEKEKVYNPLDLVLVIDSSGSMNDSDPNKTALDAVRMLVNMMPAKDSRVGIVTFNRSANVLTKNSSGSDSLINLQELTGVETIRSRVSSIKYSGGTGIGNALYAATDLLNSSSDNAHTKAIILFTDGVNDFGYNKIAAAKCDENELNAIMWAKNNNCCIYSVGYDYVTPSGISSMGSDGEGLKKLKNISDNTNGKFKSINNISDIEQLLIDFLADVCDLNYKTVATIPGDGGKHECKIPVSPSVIEANIRIAGGSAGSIKNGDIKLYDPSGREIQLKNSGNVRYDADATAASIKVVMPTPGEWVLSVSGINGDDIHVGLLEHFKMNLTSQLVFPTGNPEGIAYENDVVGIKTWLSYDGKTIQDNDLYDAVTSAKATCVSRANPDDTIVVSLERNGKSFEGSFIIPKDSYYDITVRLDWDTVYREDSSLEIKSTKIPLSPNGTINNVKVNKGKTITIDNIFSYVISSDNEPVTVIVKNSTNDDAAKISISDDKMDITGIKGWWAKTFVTLEYKDQQGNTVEQAFKVSVGDPWATALVVTIIFIITLLVLLIIYLLYKKTIVIVGKIRVTKIAEAVDSGGIEPDVYNLIFESNFKYDIGARPSKLRKFGSTENQQNKGGFGSSAFGFGAKQSGFAQQKTGFGNNSGFTTQENNFGSNNSSFGNPKSGFGVQQDTFIETIDQSKFNGEMELGIVLENERNLFKVFDAFAEKYKNYMTTNGTVDSKKAKDVRNFINQLSVLKDVKIIGTSFGKNGIQLKLPKKSFIKSHSLRIERSKIKTNTNNGKFVTIKLSLPLGEENGKKICYYLEIEYKN